jgi:hypothetical protein
MKCEERREEEKETLCLGNPNQAMSRIIVMFIAQYTVFNNTQSFITDTYITSGIIYLIDFFHHLMLKMSNKT